MKKLRVLLMAVLFLGFFQTNLFSIIYSRVEGVILDKENKTPLKNVSVNLFYVTTNRVSLFPAKNTKTDTKGVFKIDDVLKGKYVISCDLDGYVSLSPFSSIMMKPYPDNEEDLIYFEIGEGKIKYFELIMEKGGMLKVHVSKKDGNGTSDFKDVRIAISRSEYSGTKKSNFSYTVADVATDQNGNYSHGGLIPDIEYSLLIHPLSSLIGLPQFERTFKIEKNKTTELEFLYDLTDQTGLNGTIQIKNKIPFSGNIYLWIIENKKGNCVFNGNLVDKSAFNIKNINPGYYLLNLTVWDEEGNQYRKNVYVNVEKGISKKVDFNFE